MPQPERILFVTGRLAEYSLRKVVSDLSEAAGFDYDVAVLGISVAALMRVEWVSRKLHVPAETDRVIVPGFCRGELQVLQERFAIPFTRGPKDLHDLPEFFGRAGLPPPDLSEYDIEILAEINYATRLDDAELLRQAEAYGNCGADVIDLGCISGEPSERVGRMTRLLRDEGFRVSIDSVDRIEVEDAVDQGAELVLNCNSTNVGWLSKLDVEVVAVPEDPGEPTGLERVVQRLYEAGIRFRVDPLLEPVGFGFAASLERYFQARRRWPDAEMLMGVGNLTELSEVDSAGVNFLLASVCQELKIRSVLTTQVANWAHSAVRELDLARRLVHYSLANQTLPKRVDPSLVLLRDSKVRELGPETLNRLASHLQDANFRIFVERGEIHIMNRNGYWRARDSQELFRRILEEGGRPLDAEHAFYLGCELSKAETALRLEKQYTQDAPLTWGFLTESPNNTMKEISPPEDDCL